MAELSNADQHRNDLSEMVSELSTARNFIKAMEELEGERAAGSLGEIDFYELAAIALGKLPDLDLDNIKDDTISLLRQALHVCLNDHREARIPLGRCRESLRHWIDGLPTEIRHQIREEAITEIAKKLEADGDARAASWTLSHIGYGSESVRHALWGLIRRNKEEAGDTALSVLTGLGIAVHDRGAIKDEIQSRAEVRYSRSLVTAIGNMADPELCLMAIRKWIKNSEEEDRIETSIVISALARALDARSEDNEFQDTIWQELSKIVDAAPERFLPTIALGRIATRCNSAYVVPSLLRWIAPRDTKGNESWSRYLLGLRLEECVRPRQLRGWAEKLPEEAKRWLVSDAIQDTGIDVLAPTREFYTKEMAWKTLLRARTKPDIGLFEESIANESHRFLQQRLMDLMASFQVDPLPGFIHDLVTERVNLGGQDASSELARRMSAQKVATSAGTWEGFSLLLRFGTTYEGKVLRQTTNALAEAAIHLAEDNPRRVINELLSRMSMEAEEHHRKACSTALEMVAGLHSEHIDGYTGALVDFSYDDAREPYERASILGALSRTIKWDPTDDYTLALKEWARNPDRWVGGASLELLARKGILAEADDLLQMSIGLERKGTRWDLAANGPEYEWRGFFIGLLYDRDPEQFELALRSICSSGEFAEVLQAARWVRKKHRDGHRPVSQKLAKTIIERISTGQSKHFAEIDLFGLAGDLAPAALIQEPWELEWHLWLPEARVALTKSLGSSGTGEKEQNRKAEMLQLLAADGNFAVRRAAYRALANDFPDTLRGLALSWADSESLELTKRAAEAWGWLSGYLAQVDGVGNSNALAEFQAHPEPEVRTSLKQGIEEGRRQAWAQNCLAKVLNTMSENADELLEVWPYGDALGEIGDDAVIDELGSFMADADLSPHLRHWLGEIVDSVRKSWRKRTKEWPEPWFAWSGEITTGTGTVILGRKRLTETSYSLWRQPAVSPNETKSWGGAFWPAPFVGGGSALGKLILEDGRSGKFLLNDVRGEIATFTGTGSYPR